MGADLGVTLDVEVPYLTRGDVVCAVCLDSTNRGRRGMVRRGAGRVSTGSAVAAVPWGSPQIRQWSSAAVLWLSQAVQAQLASLIPIFRLDS